MKRRHYDLLDIGENMNGAMLQVISGVRRFAVATRLRKCMGFVTFAETYLLVESGKRGKRNVKDYKTKLTKCKKKKTL